MRLTSSLFLAALLIGVAGCRTGDVMQKVPISGGGYVTVPLTRGGPKPGEAEGYRVTVASLQPGKETRDTYYTFGLVAQNEPALRRIRITDISDETAVVLLDVENPVFEGREWKATTENISAEDPRMKWMYQITLALRVYRFTLTRPDGREFSFDHVAAYPPVFKAMIRNRWGEKY